MSSYALVYGCFGFGLAVFSNTVRKLPAMRRPWEHVLYFGIGTWLGTKVQDFKENNNAMLEEALAQRAELAAEREAKLAARRAAAVESS